MVRIVVTTAANASDDEVAACIAAVRIAIQSDDSARSEQPRHSSCWKQAALLEGTGRARKVNVPPALNNKSLWLSSNQSRILGLLIWALCASVPAALAQNSYSPMPALRPPLPEPSQGYDMPAAAPLVPAVVRSMAVPTVEEPKMVRVGLALQKVEIAIGLPDGGQLKDLTTGALLAELPPQSSWKIAALAPGGYTQFRFDGTIANVADRQVLIAQGSQYKSVAFTPNGGSRVNLVPLPNSEPPRFFLPAIKSSSDGPGLAQKYQIIPNGPDFAFVYGGKVYRGLLHIQTSITRATADKKSAPTVTAEPRPLTMDLINTVELEDYLQSVVPSEMPSSWPLEALKAQAVAARSYAIANLGKHSSEGYDVKPTIEDQVYSGVTAESVNSNRAVAETKGLVVTHQGKTVAAYFHSASGGHTEFAENVWSRNVPYLKAVPDFDDESPHFNWTRNFDAAAAEQALNANNRSVGSLLSIMPVWRGVSPRVRWLMVNGSDKTLLISGEEARKIFALPSSSFNVAPSAASYVFAGRGFGHGLGLSQWGAKRLAESGLKAEDILNYYYKDVTVQAL